MTQQDDITQRVLPAEHHLNELMRLTQPWPNATIPCATVRSHVEQALSKLRAPVADERAAVDPCGYVAVKVSAVDWLKDKFPALTIKAGLCERIGGRLYTITRLMRDHDTALASAPVADAIQWPTMPESKGQSPILFEDGYAEGWAKCMDECRRAVSQASAPVAGEAQPSDAEVLKVYAETVAEYADGRGFEAGTVAFARSLLRRYAAPQASAEYERGHADGWAAGWDQAIKQPQADKDGAEQALKDLVTHGVSVQRIAPADFLAGGQQRAGDVDERAAFEAWAYRAGMGPKFRESMFAAWEARAALASAPVAGEARTEGGDPASPRDDSDRTYDKPIGYLPAYELGRLHSGHSANLRSAKFGPSALDGDVPVYLEPPNGDAAPQASECECSRKSKAVSDSEAQL